MYILMATTSVLLVGTQIATAQTVVIDSADLPYVTALLHSNSHEVTTTFFEDVGRYDGSMMVGDDTIYTVTFDNHMQVFCGNPDDAISVKPGDVVTLAGKVLLGGNVFVMQTCFLRVATLHEQEIHAEINR